MWRDQFFNIENGKAPFKFIYKGENSDGFLETWPRETRAEECDGYTLYTLTYAEPGAGMKLQVSAEIKLYHDFPAADWRLFMENTGSVNTGLIESIDSISLILTQGSGPFQLHRANGGLSSLYDFAQSTHEIPLGRSKLLRTYGGRSTNDANAYFTVDSGEGGGRLLTAIGWTGQWQCAFTHAQDGLHIAGGLEESHFHLYPGEKIALPSMLSLFCEEDTDRAYSLFRRLILKHYVPELKGRDKSPYLFCNTCFTRGGGWLDECNADNQISLIKALHPLDVEAIITDAGWYPGGWANNVGNWYPDPERYPEGIAPVAAAGAEDHMRYGLWFELERVAHNSKFALERPELMLRNQSAPTPDGAYENYLANLGDPAAVDYIYAIVEAMLGIPNFSCYRQDFNIEPLDIWRANDTPDRVGMTEIKYINGLYTFLDRIRANHPDVFMNGCASGGRRLDIEMIKRFHTHQTTDYWFDNTVDQNTQFSLAHYLPNTCFTSHINRYDDPSSNSVIGASLCLGWIADSETESFNGTAPFNFERARALIDRYQKVRPYLNCDFYPLTGPDHTEQACIAMEYLDGEAQDGILMIYKRRHCPIDKIQLRLKGLEAQAVYTLTDLTAGTSQTVLGSALLNGYIIPLPSEVESKVIHFSKSE